MHLELNQETVSSLANTVLRFGDQSGEYTDEEEVAIDAIYDLIDADNEIQCWRKHIPKAFIIVALRICKMDVDVVFKTAKALYAVAMDSYPDLVARVNAENLKKIADAKIFEIIKRPTDSGPTVMLFRIKNWKTSDANLEELVFYSVLFFLTAAKSSKEIQRSGFILIGDMDGFKLSHARHVTTIDLLSKIGTILTSVPTKMVKGTVLINCYTMFLRTFDMFKWVLPGNVRKIIHLTQKDMSPITRLISKDKLPVELGGTVPNEAAFDGGVTTELFEDVKLIPNFKYMINEALIFTGYKQRS